MSDQVRDQNVGFLMMRLIFMFGALDTNKDKRVRFNVASRLQIPLVKHKTRYESLSNTQYHLNGREE